MKPTTIMNKKNLFLLPLTDFFWFDFYIKKLILNLDQLIILFLLLDYIFINIVKFKK